MTALLAVLTAVATVAAWLLRSGVRRRALCIERGSDKTAEKVHRLQRVALTGGLVMPVLYAAGTALLIGAVASRRGHHGAVGWRVLTFVAYLPPSSRWSPSDGLYVRPWRGCGTSR